MKTQGFHYTRCKMYSILLVDDEHWVLKRIKSTYKWEPYGFEVIAVVTKPVDIREIINEKKVRETQIDCEFAIISGFSDFEYAREALRNSVFDYCLKPVKEDETEKTLIKLKNHLDKKNNNVDNAEISNKEFKNILKYIAENYDKKLQLNELSKKFFINSNYCCYLFKKFLNTTYSEYVANIRMKEARKLVDDVLLSIDEIAKRVGYDDYFYFNKVFKKHYGMTPMQLRKKNREKNNDEGTDFSRKSSSKY